MGFKIDVGSFVRSIRSLLITILTINLKKTVILVDGADLCVITLFFILKIKIPAKK